jgi:RNA polymerase sigma factor (sigma-70 family)
VESSLWDWTREQGRPHAYVAADDPHPSERDRQGARQLAERFARERGTALRAVARHHGADINDIADVVQEALVGFIRHFPGDAGDERGAWSYLCRAVQTRAWRIQRTARRRPVSRLPEHERPELTGHPTEETVSNVASADPLERAVEREALATRRALLNRVPAEWRAPILLSAAGYGTTEIAQMLSLTERQVRKRIEKANARVRHLQRVREPTPPTAAMPRALELLGDRLKEIDHAITALDRDAARLAALVEERKIDSERVGLSGAVDFTRTTLAQLHYDRCALAVLHGSARRLPGLSDEELARSARAKFVVQVRTYLREAPVELMELVGDRPIDDRARRVWERGAAIDFAFREMYGHGVGERRGQRIGDRQEAVVVRRHLASRLEATRNLIERLLRRRSLERDAGRGLGT